jgi:hypothetical protein
LRSSNIDASAGSVEELKHIVAQIRPAWSQVRIVVRGDSGFCREELMAWCEAEGVDYLLGLGFELPVQTAPVVPNVPKREFAVAMAVAVNCSEVS